MDTQISGRPPTAEIPWSEAAPPPPPPPRRSRLRIALVAAAAVVLVAAAVIAFLALRGNDGSNGNTNATVTTAAPGGAARVRLRVPDRIADFVRRPASSSSMIPYYVIESYARAGTAPATFVLGVSSYRSDDEAARALPSRVEGLRSSNPAIAPAVTVSSGGVEYSYVAVPSASQSAPVTMYFWRAGSVLFTVTAGGLDQATVLALAPQAEAAVLSG